MAYLQGVRTMHWNKNIPTCLRLTVQSLQLKIKNKKALSSNPTSPILQLPDFITTRISIHNPLPTDLTTLYRALAYCILTPTLKQLHSAFSVITHAQPSICLLRKGVGPPLDIASGAPTSIPKT